MCDYSLMGIPNRLARDGEELIVHRFPTGSLGLASPIGFTAESKPAQTRNFWSIVKEFFHPAASLSIPAVCIPPGARLLMHNVPAPMQKQLGLGPDEEVTFVQLSAAVNAYRDALRFRTGHQVLLQDLVQGQRVEVIDLIHRRELERRIKIFMG